MSLTSITLSGTIKKDAEQRTTANGTAVTNFMMNILRYESRAKEEKAYPVKVTMWGDSFTDMLGKLKAGTRVVATGRLQIDQFNDHTGKAVRLLNIEANRVQLLSDVANASSPALNESSYDEDITSSGSEATDAYDNQEVPF
jgi:single-strand DNA-binding protein